MYTYMYCIFMYILIVYRIIEGCTVLSIHTFWQNSPMYGTEQLQSEHSHVPRPSHSSDDPGYMKRWRESGGVRERGRVWGVRGSERRKEQGGGGGGGGGRMLLVQYQLIYQVCNLL